MSKYADLKREFESQVSVENLDPSGSTTKAWNTEAQFRFWLLRLIFEIHGDLDSLAADYKRLVKMQEQRQK